MLCFFCQEGSGQILQRMMYVTAQHALPTSPSRLSCFCFELTIPRICDHISRVPTLPLFFSYMYTKTIK